MVKFVATPLTATEQLTELLRQRHTEPERLNEIDAEIRDRFSTTCAVVVIDMADFSRLTYVEGIIATLQQIQTMRDLTLPFIEQRQGRVLKFEADNVYATFDTATAALATMEALMAHLYHIGIGISVGIGYGEVLLIGDRNLFGHEVNLASKLGEDLAGDNEILLTESAYTALSATERRFVSITQEISDVTFTHYRLRPSS